jgi:TatD DNase family protein
MVDSHCHLADEAFAADLEAVVARAREAGVVSAMCILAAGDEKESARATRLRALWPAVRFSVGVHPHQAGGFAGVPAAAADVVRRGLEAEGARAIGEIGLDYHYDFSPRDVQRDVFEAQVALARELSLPIVIHTREATDHTFEVLRSAGDGAVRGIFHCFTGDVAMARRALELDFHISLSGIVSFPRATELREVAAMVPDNRLLIETDAPYLAPAPHRGKRNEPAFVTRVAEVVAEVRKAPVAEIGRLAARNLDALLGPNASLQKA